MATDAVHAQVQFIKKVGYCLCLLRAIVQHIHARANGLATGQAVDSTDTNLYDTVLRIEVAAETTAEVGNRNVTVVLPDGQSVTVTNGLVVTTP